MSEIDIENTGNDEKTAEDESMNVRDIGVIDIASQENENIQKEENKVQDIMQEEKIEEINTVQKEDIELPKEKEENIETTTEIIEKEIEENDDAEKEPTEENLTGDVSEAADEKVEIETIKEEGEEETGEEVKEETSEKPSWYIIHTYSGHEYKVKERIEQRAESMNMSHKITKVIVPEEESVEIKNNKRVERTNKMFPGYVFVEMILDNETWFLIRKIPGVSKFLGPKSTPLPVTEKEMLRVLQQTGVKTKKIEVDFEIGELIKVISGPFRGYQGGINEIFPDRGKLKAKISIFGRETPVELDFDQVEKVIK